MTGEKKTAVVFLVASGLILASAIAFNRTPHAVAPDDSASAREEKTPASTAAEQDALRAAAVLSEPIAASAPSVMAESCAAERMAVKSSPAAQPLDPHPANAGGRTTLSSVPANAQRSPRRRAILPWRRR